VTAPLQPVLVMPVYRGGAKFKRALESVREAERFFRRVVISLNSPRGSSDESAIEDFRASGDTKIEVIHTGEELPWIPHQYFWLDYLESTGEGSSSWVMWFAHDDELRPHGMSNLIDEAGNWPLTKGTIYLGPWGVRYDPPGELFSGDRNSPLESWTSFPIDGPLRMSVAQWIADQLIQPTYINMSGCVTQLASFQRLRNFPYAKPGGMRIEMASAAAPNNKHAQEFNEPIVITYTSKGSDRTTYAAVARRDDAHLMAWLGNYLVQHPSAIPTIGQAFAKIAGRFVAQRIGQATPISEDWRRRGNVEA